MKIKNKLKRKMEIELLEKDEFIPSTITIKASFNNEIDTEVLSSFLPVKNIFDKSGQRLKLISGSRESIKYFGVEEVIVSVCYKQKRRGMRTGAMNNMVSIDIQVGGKNIHLKVSSTSITSVGTSSIEYATKVCEIVLKHFRKLQANLNLIPHLENKDETIESIKTELSNYDKIPTKSKFIEQFYQKEYTYNNDFFKICLDYFEDQDDISLFLEKIETLKTDMRLYKDDIQCTDYNIFNSVYHIKPIKNKNFRMPLHRLAPYLASLGVNVEYHNWTSEGVNICFDIEEEKEGENHVNKEYKHRFTIHETSKIRQCSPTSKEEAFKNYLGVINLIKKFFTKPEIDFNKYIRNSLKENE
jgi:hypothetical protein